MSITVHDYADLISIFNSCFQAQYNTILVKGEEEPIYLPANDTHPVNRVIFAHGFFSSALHECAHWLIAGEERRTQIDFGYWYAPDGRTPEEQKKFQVVEVKPQALEWILSQASNHPFRVSLDNLLGEESDTLLFKEAVYQQVEHYCTKGLSRRAAQFRNALCAFYNTPRPLNIDSFDWDTMPC